jgi:uncharacterized protein YdcH (DUF465 family)
MQFASQDDLKAHLLATDEHFAQLAAQHSDLKAQVAALEAKAELTLEEEMEEHRLKKLKLKLKDEMAQILSHHSEPAHA